jgi:di/tricarboxylate transporter
MSTALEKTGVSNMIASFIVNNFGAASPYVGLAAIYFATSVMTIFISNTVTAMLMAPIALQCAEGIGVSPVPFMFAVTVAASMCFASPFSTPPNALVMNAGQYTFKDYIKVGLPLQVIMGVVMVLVLPLLFPFSKIDHAEPAVPDEHVIEQVVEESSANDSATFDFNKTETEVV